MTDPLREKAGTSRRNFLKTKGLVGATAISGLGLSGCLSNITGGGQESGPIKVGQLESQSGNLAIFGQPRVKTIELAISEINDNGGLNGREVQHLAPDTKSQVAQYKELANKLILEDEVDILIGGETSASREALRSIVDNQKQLYIYPSFYEGGVLDEYTFLMGGTPVQQVQPLVDYMVDNFGTKVYTIAADYNFGQRGALWGNRYFEEFGAENVGEEFFPLSQTDFTSLVERISSEDPDWIFSMLVGANHYSFYKQAESAGLDTPVGAYAPLGAEDGSHKALSSPVLEDVYVPAQYWMELDTSRNQQFIGAMNDMFSDLGYVSQGAEASYAAIQFWKQAVESAGTADMVDVHSAMEEQVTLSVPEGDIQSFPQSHHFSHNIHLGHIGADHSVTIEKTFENVEPSWVNERGNLNTDQSTWENPRTDYVSP